MFMVKSIGESIGELREVGDVYSDNRFKAATMIVVPVAVTLTASYLINRVAYPKDFTIMKWIGIPVILGLISLASVAGVYFLLGPREEPVYEEEE